MDNLGALDLASDGTSGERLRHINQHNHFG